MIVKQTFFRRKLRSLLRLLFSKLENNNNADFATNGEEFFVDNLFEYLKKNVKGESVLFDVGANLGDYTQILLDKSAQINGNVQIHLFEPTRSSFEVLKNKISGDDRTVLNNKAISNKNETAEIFYEREQSSLASFYRRNLDAYSIKMNESEIVETIRLDRYIEEGSIGHIHFLKIDVEGHEVAALEGLGFYLRDDFIDFIQFEYGGANLDSHTSLMELFALFEKAGFRVVKVMPRGLDIRSYEPWMDNFQYANYVAVSEKIVEKIQ